MTTVTFVEAQYVWAACGNSVGVINFNNQVGDYLIATTNGSTPTGWNSSGTGAGLIHRNQRATAVNESHTFDGSYVFALVFRPDNTDYIITEALSPPRGDNGYGTAPVTAFLAADATDVMLRVTSLSSSGYITNIGCGQYDGSSLTGPTVTHTDGQTCGTCGDIVNAGDQHGAAAGIGYTIGGIGDTNASISLSGENSLGGQDSYEVYLREVTYETLFLPLPAVTQFGWGILTS